MVKQNSLFCSQDSKTKYIHLICEFAAKLALILALFFSVVAPALAEGSGEQRYSSKNWTPELIALDKASSAARAYAENNDGVGILIHLGQNIPNEHIKNGDELGRLYVRRFAKLGVKAKYFYRQNDTLATGITYHIGHLIHGSGNGTEVKLLREAWNAAPDVVRQLKIVKGLDLPKPTGG